MGVTKRKEAHREQVRISRKFQHPTNAVSQLVPHEIDPEYLLDPILEGKRCELYIGRGSFSVVRLQTYRDIVVAVKEMLPQPCAPTLLMKQK